MQLEVKRGFSLLELLSALALTGIFIYAFSGFFFSGNKDKEWLDVTFCSFAQRAVDLTSRILIPHGIEIDISGKCMILKIVRLEDGDWKDVQSVVCPKSISLDLENSEGYQLYGETPVFPLSSILGKGSEARCAVFIVNRRNFEYRF